MTGVELTGNPRNGDVEQSPPVSSRWADLAGTSEGSADAQVDGSGQVTDWPEAPEPAPLLEVCVDLAPGMHTRTDRCIGDVRCLRSLPVEPGWLSASTSAM